MPKAIPWCHLCLKGLSHEKRLGLLRIGFLITYSCTVKILKFLLFLRAATVRNLSDDTEDF